MFGKGDLSGVVTKSPQGRHDPSFLGTMCKGEAHGDFDLRTMPSESLQASRVSRMSRRTCLGRLAGALAYLSFCDLIPAAAN
jgi:hypothetical protein